MRLAAVNLHLKERGTDPAALFPVAATRGRRIAYPDLSIFATFIVYTVLCTW
jgi:hypothetical protein